MSDVPQLIRGLSEQMESTLKQAGRVLEAKEREEKAQRSALELRIDGLAKFRDLATKEKESVIEAYRTATGASGRPPSQEAEAKFWAKIGELDTAIQKVRGASKSRPLCWLQPLLLFARVFDGALIP